jgi:ribosome-binding factor A
MPQSSALVTITKVDVAPDLRTATVYVSVLGDQEQEQRVLSLLKRTRHHWQQGLAKNVILKYTPVLRFKLDHSAANADRVLSILEELDIPDETDADEDQPLP